MQLDPAGQPFVLRAVGAQIRVIRFQSLLPQPCASAPPLVDDCRAAPSASLSGSVVDVSLTPLLWNLHCQPRDVRYYSRLFSSCRLSPLHLSPGVCVCVCVVVKTLSRPESIETEASPRHLGYKTKTLYIKEPFIRKITFYMYIYNYI